MSVSVLASDREFDSIYDERIRALSEVHWTPVRVAARAAQLLVGAGATRILDIGSGVGKFCIVGALTTGAHFVGVEWRGHLAEAATRAATILQIDRATFVHANAETFSFEGFDGLYLYNPYYEQISRFMVKIDDTTERSKATYRRFVESTRAKLVDAKPPVAVVTLGGFGRAMPLAYDFISEEPAANDHLELWVKR